MTEEQLLEAHRVAAARCLRAIRSTSQEEVLQVLGIAVTGVFDTLPEAMRKDALARWVATLCWVVREGCDGGRSLH